ncbi:precorrin-6A/cobalt-precorrin-6A reductase [Streptomyces sp. 1114.5]|uniref:cobalt-precorrin-6A reductase n=1 Tax=Streptomyces sp. 1114.5 TaxID=1938830 RepID=UPI000EAF9CAE|nr:cobalt-precorrin-6A reductase [Streptomyces sp. 1114.5]RKT11819.1 precorrin-6A/cobalt-precorrin-6A reductase [Streptomyces sp. 1114.5]
MRHLLILGGTTEGRALAAAVDGRPSLRVTSSLAGRTAQPRLPAGEVRIGGFGGPDGLAHWLREQRVDAVIDATHPFAAGISQNAALAAAATGVPLLALRRPGFTPVDGDRWLPVPSLAAAADLLPCRGERVFLTIGRQGIASFAHVVGAHFLARSVDPPEPPLPPSFELLLDRGPFTIHGEEALLRAHDIDILVTKDSGGAATAPKLAAARGLQLPVVIVERPPVPDGLPVVPDVAGAVHWLEQLG